MGILLLMPMFHAEARSTVPPTFEKHFAKPLIDGDSADWKGTEKVFNISVVSRDKTIRENIEALFFPAGNGGVIWDILRYVGYFLVFIAIVMAATKLIISAKKPDDLKAALSSFVTILVGSALYFWVVWIFTTLFKIPGINWTSGLRDTVVDGSGLLFFIMTLLKAGAFFYAVVMIVWTGFQMMNPTSGEEWWGKKLIQNLTGVIAALVGLKVVDFLYYIASQQNFTQQAWDFILTIARFLAYLSGTVIVLMIIYAGYQLVIDGGKWENFKKAKNTLINILLAVVSLFFFLFVLYQIFAEFN